MTDAERQRLLPILACAAGIATFGSMDAAMKGISLEVGAYNALFWRCLVAAGMAAVLIAVRPIRRPGRAALRIHLIRGTVVAAMAYLFFYGLLRTPIAEAIAISFIAPLIALYLAVVLLGERVGAHSVLASLMGLAGVIVIVAGKAGAGTFDAEARWGIAAILGSAVLYAYNLILQRQQAQIASPQEIALFQNAIVTGWLALFLPFYGAVPGMGEGQDAAAIWGLTGLAALLSIVSVLLLSWAYARAEAQALVPVEYSMFLWAALWGWLFFGEELGWATLGGTGLIVAGCLIVARRRPELAGAVEEVVI